MPTNSSVIFVPPWPTSSSHRANFAGIEASRAFSMESYFPHRFRAGANPRAH